MTADSVVSTGISEDDVFEGHQVMDVSVASNATDVVTVHDVDDGSKVNNER